MTWYTTTCLLVKKGSTIHWISCDISGLIDLVLTQQSAFFTTSELLLTYSTLCLDGFSNYSRDYYWMIKRELLRVNFKEVEAVEMNCENLWKSVHHIIIARVN